jgi:conjugal transfer pilus assembly protein TraU
VKESKVILLLFFITLTLLIAPANVSGVCKGIMFNPVTDVCWQCVFPIKVGGVPVVPGPDPLTTAIPDVSTAGASGPICVCPMPPPLPPRIGIPISYWEPGRLIETVKEPFCFPTLGTSLSGMFGYELGGSTNKVAQGAGNAAHLTSAQFHWFIFLPVAFLELIKSVACFEPLDGFDLGYISEVDPLWNNELLAFILNPEALLFGNPIAQLACIPDSIASNLGLPLDPLFWCAGSWGSSYPLAGRSGNDKYVEANAHLAAKATYKMARQLLLWDGAVWVCAVEATPIWIKSHYRYQIAKPVRDVLCHPVGRSGLIWAWIKNPPFVGDNFLWILFRKQACCLL